jgi:hypothetical protein
MFTKRGIIGYGGLGVWSVSGVGTRGLRGEEKGIGSKGQIKCRLARE